MSDLHDMLNDRAQQLAASMRHHDEFDAGAARGAVKRKRRVRAATTSALAIAGVAVLGTGAYAIYGNAWDSEPALPTEAPTEVAQPEPSASASATASASPEPSPEPEVSETVAPAVSVDPAQEQIWERLVSPTTGETWFEPRVLAAAELPEFALEPWYGLESMYEIGEVGGDSIIAGVVPVADFYMTYDIEEVYVVRDGQAVMVPCPWSRADAECTDSKGWEDAGGQVDDNLHFDSLTYPTEVLTRDYGRVTLITSAGIHDLTQPWGRGYRFPGINAGPNELAHVNVGERTELVALGDSTLVRDRTDSDIPGTAQDQYFVVTPFGSEISLTQPYLTDYSIGAVLWDDGRDTFTHPASPGADTDTEVYPVVAPTAACWGANELVDLDHDPADWVAAGTGDSGKVIYLPVEGGNDVTRAVWETQRDSSYGATLDPWYEYPYATYEEFLEARSAFTWQRGEGEWVIGLDAYAYQRFYECA